MSHHAFCPPNFVKRNTGVLSEKFGESYLRYKAAVRRYL
jgi:hypothetical protein